MLRAEAGVVAGGFELEFALEVPSGQCLVLAGPSGAGKTTILRTIAGLQRAASGRIACRDHVWLDSAAGINLPAEQRRCGVVFQDYALFPHLRAWQNVAHPLHGLPRRERRKRAAALLERFGVAGVAERRPHELSGGERQRVALARTLASHPVALLLDEPLAALDPSRRAAAARELVDVIEHADLPALLVTHDFTEAALLGTHVAVVDDGRIVQRGTPSQLASSPTSAFVADLTGAVVLTGEAAPDGAGGLTRVALDGGGSVLSTDEAVGPVAACVHPWEITLSSGRNLQPGSARNHLAATITSVTSIGSRTRVGLAAPQELTAEISTAAAEALALHPGTPVVASWKAAATRLLPREAAAPVPH